MGISADRRPPGLHLHYSASTLSKTAPEVPPPVVMLAFGLGVTEARLRLRNKFGGEDGG